LDALQGPSRVRHSSVAASGVVADGSEYAIAADPPSVVFNLTLATPVNVASELTSPFGDQELPALVALHLEGRFTVACFILGTRGGTGLATSVPGAGASSSSSESTVALDQVSLFSGKAVTAASDRHKPFDVNIAIDES